ncbi:PKD domain-containing protein [uncultured Chitinophaga sp.]|uniref:LamG-like jellyroll fold domain-containing protein n=1 Tax=uncultured Chitinophaga sp. TaxID=339340 RepID=UPI0025EC8B4C|nr:PKD domain-containing protein [uncultured Chitinophaga sp.]
MKRLFYLFLCLSGLFACNKDETSGGADIKEVVFEADREEISAGDSIIFKDQSVGYVNKWKWTFKGGTPETSNLSSPKVIYNTPGVYEVTLVVSNKFTNKTITKTDYIKVDYNRVKVNFTKTADVYFTNELVTFRDTTTGKPQTWEWEFVPVGGGAAIKSTLQHPSVMFTDTGYYNVTLTASNPQYSDKVTKTNFIRILDAAAISSDFTSLQSATYTGGSISLTDASVGNVTGWEWTITGAETFTSTDRNPSFTFNTAGRYKVSLKVTNPFNSSTKTTENYLLVVPGGDLAAFFPFNNNVADAGPNKIGTSVLGGGITFGGTDRLGSVGNTSAFNGSSGLLVTNHAATNFGSGNYTVACWVKTSLTTRMMLWQESGRNGTNDNQTWIRIGDNTTDRVTRFDVEDNTGSAFVNLATATGRLSDDAWHHVVAVREGLVTSVYIDGTKRGSTTASGLKVVSNDQDFKIGFQEGATSNSSFFAGNIDDVIIYRKALTAAEITALFNL